MIADDRTRKALVARVNTALGTLAQIHDELLAIKRAIDGTNPIKDAMTAFDQGWRRLYQTDVPYEFTKTIDPSHFKRLLTKWSMEILKQRIAAYFADRDPFLLRNKHPMNLFISRINTYAPRTMGEASGRLLEDPSEPPSDCKHMPHCQSEIECTSRRRDAINVGLRT